MPIVNLFKRLKHKAVASEKAKSLIADILEKTNNSEEMKKFIEDSKIEKGMTDIFYDSEVFLEQENIRKD